MKEDLNGNTKMTTKQISSKYVIEKIYRDLGINEELNVDDVYEWIFEALMKIGVYKQFTEETTMLDIENCKASLPCNLHKLKLVTYNGEIISWAGNSLANNYFCKECTLPPCCTEVTFFINDSYIYLNFGDGVTTSGQVCIEYIGIAVDDDGYPTIPDDVYYMEACKAYIVKKLDYIQWRRGLIPDKMFEHSDREWNFYCGAAKGAGNMPDLHEMEELKNVWVRLLPLQNEYKNGFVNLTKQEQKRIK